MDPVSLTIITVIAALALSLGIIIEFNWKALRPLGRWIRPARLLGVLRIVQGLSTFTIAFIAITALLTIFLQDSVLTTIASCIGSSIAVAAVGATIVKRGTKLRLDEVHEETDLTMRISAHVNDIVEVTASRILEKVDAIAVHLENVRSMMNVIQRDFQSHDENVNALHRRCDGLQYSLAQIGKAVEGCNAAIQTHRQKLEELNLRIDEVMQLQEECVRMLEVQEQAAEEANQGRAKLTTANGIASRRLGDEAQRGTADILRSMGFEIEEHYGVGWPDYIILWNNERIAVGAHKAYSLGGNNKQRTISRRDIEAEVKWASELKLPLVIIVTNLRNKRRWAVVIPPEKLKEFKRITTPIILADDKPETRKICDESILELQEILTRLRARKQMPPS